MIPAPVVVIEFDALRFLADKAGAARIMLGSDMPFPIGDMEPCKVVHAAGFGAAERASILGNNAQGVFRIRPDCWCRG